ncbi:hypothetical protein ALP55_200003 [Pseudomonas coronafaciens pv. oryzae]|nr:hypothetical protein ALP55_200003 [Pseudomonas coronafaciens pv. oryzae]
MKNIFGLGNFLISRLIQNIKPSKITTPTVKLVQVTHSCLKLNQRSVYQCFLIFSQIALRIKSNSIYFFYKGNYRKYSFFPFIRFYYRPNTFNSLNKTI